MAQSDVWVDLMVEMVDAVVAVQLRSVDWFISAQCRAAGVLAESALAVVTAGGAPSGDRAGPRQ